MTRPTPKRPLRPSSRAKQTPLWRSSKEGDGGQSRALKIGVRDSLHAFSQPQALTPPPAPPRRATGQPGRRAGYLNFCREVQRERHGRCDSCGHTAGEVGQDRLHVHHLMHVAVLGIDDPAVTDTANTLLLCNSCHALFHPLKRTYRLEDWQAAGRNRGRAMR